jgi:hypothetical protein
MLALVLGSSPTGFTHCRVHQRAWVASLGRWVAFHVPTRDGSLVTNAPCDRCGVQPHGAEAVGGRKAWSAAGAGHDHGEEPWSAAAQGTYDLWEAGARRT